MKSKNLSFYALGKIVKFHSVFLITFISLLFTACDSSGTQDKQSTTVSENNQSASAAKKDYSGNELPQNGNYSSLFTETLKDCDYLAISEFANAIGAREDQVKIDRNQYSCGYVVTEPGGIITKYHFSKYPSTKESIQKEIKTVIEDAKVLKKESRLVEIRKSASGDTYLAMHQDRHVNILNDNYETIITVTYLPEFKTGEKDVESIRTRQDETREKAFAIANAVLNKYKQ